MFEIRRVLFGTALAAMLVASLGVARWNSALAFESDAKVAIQQPPTRPQSDRPQIDVDPRVQQLAKRLLGTDANGDGVLTPDELTNPRLFRRLDTNDDGQIDPREIRLGVRGLAHDRAPDRAPPPPIRQRLHNLAKRILDSDANDDGVITADEFPQRRMFERFDANGDGQIEPSEIRAGIRELEREQVTRQAEASFDRADTNGDGVIDRDEWTAHHLRMLDAPPPDGPHPDAAPGARRRGHARDRRTDRAPEHNRRAHDRF